MASVEDGLEVIVDEEALEEQRLLLSRGTARDRRASSQRVVQGIRFVGSAKFVLKVTMRRAYGSYRDCSLQRGKAMEPSLGRVHDFTP